LGLFTRDASAIFEVKDLFTQDDAKNLIDNLYPNGISQHGRQYLFDKYVWLYDQYQNSYVSYLQILEITFELVRLWRHTDKPSRFTSLFGCLTFEDALKLKTERFTNSGDIYKVSTDNYFKADMNLLLTATIPGNILMAEKYWTGQQGPNPFWEILMNAPVKIIEKIT
jgi:hypothetical protein